MSVLATALVQQLKSRLGQAADMSLAAVPTGVGGAPDLSNDAVLMFCINRGQEWFFRYAYALLADATNTALPANTRRVAVNSLTVSGDAAGGALWAARSVYIGGTKLTRTDLPTLDVNQPAHEISASGTPTVWCDSGNPDRIELYPPPSAVSVLQIAGLALPPPLALTTTTGFVTQTSSNVLPDDIVWQLYPVLGGIEVARRVRNDAEVYSRISDLLPVAAQICAQNYERIDPVLRAWRYPTPPVIGEGLVLAK